jgi:hypothetical protein
MMEKKGSVGFMELGTKPIQGVRMAGSSAPYWLSVALSKMADAVEFEMGQFSPRIARAQRIANAFAHGADG